MKLPMVATAWAKSFRSFNSSSYSASDASTRNESQSIFLLLIYGWFSVLHLQNAALAETKVSAESTMSLGYSSTGHRTSYIS